MNSIASNGLLSDEHLNYLRSNAAISNEIAREAGLYSIKEQDTVSTPGFASRGIAFPYIDRHGGKIGLRVRVDEPQELADGSKARYLQAKGSSLTCYFIPSAIHAIFDPTQPLILTEGEKKALALHSILGKSSPIASMPGCFNFREKDKDGLSEAWEQLPIKNRTIRWLPDTDFFTNPKVTAAGKEFLSLLFLRGANIEIVSLQSPGAIEKIGADDFVVKFGAEGLKERLESPCWKLLQPRVVLDTLERSTESLSTAMDSLVMLGEVEFGQVIAEICEKVSLSKSNVLKYRMHAETRWRKLVSGMKQRIKRNTAIDLSDDREKRLVVWDTVKAIEEDGRFFRYQDQVAFIEDKRQIPDPQSLPAILNAAEIEFSRKTKDGAAYAFLPIDHARAVLHALPKSSRLPRLVLFTKTPTYDSAWNLVMPGYNDSEGIYYSGPLIKPSDGTNKLDYVLKDFAFKNAASRANFLALCLTAFLRSQYRGEHPFGAFTGNRPGLGKSTAAKLLSLIAQWGPPHSITFKANQDEFEKHLGAVARESDVIVIDNVRSRRPIQSEVLERTVTDDPVSFRLLGKSETITRPNTLVIVVTMNNATFGRDLIERALPVEFFRSEDFEIKSGTFSDPNVIETARTYLPEIVSELAGMIEKWKACGRPLASHQSRFQRWASEIGGILACNGLPEFLGNFAEASREYDEDARHLGALFASCLGENLTADELVDRCKAQDLFPDVCEAQKPATALSNVLKRNLGKKICAPRNIEFILCEGSFDSHRKVKRFIAKPTEPDLASVAGTAGTGDTFLDCKMEINALDDLDLLSSKISASETTANLSRVHAVPAANERGQLQTQDSHQFKIDGGFYDNL